MKKALTILFVTFLSFSAFAQKDLLAEADSLADLDREKQFVHGTFKGTRIINGHSIETPAKQDLHFVISHRFGTINKGIYELFGLDHATIRLGFDYGINDRLAIGTGRSSLEKTYDGYVKYKLLRQKEEAGMPISLVAFASTAMNTLRFSEDEKERKFESRLSYTTQLLIARKFSERLSIQLTPTYIHRNYVNTRADENDVYAVGFAGRFKLNKRIALTGEYFYVLPGKTADDFEDVLSFGFDIETGGHVFQVHFTNAQGMIEKFFIPQTTGRWYKKEIYFGFNISRAFTLGEKKPKKAW